MDDLRPARVGALTGLGAVLLGIGLIAACSWSEPIAITHAPVASADPEAEDDAATTHAASGAAPRPTDTAAESAFAEFGTVTVAPEIEVAGAGSDIDSIAFWEAPDPDDTLMFVTAKASQLVEVWRYPFAGSELMPLMHATFAPDSQVNGVAVDQRTDRLYVSISRPPSTVSVFDLPTLEFAGELHSGSQGLGPEPNLGLLRHADGSTRLYVSSESTVYIYDTENGERLGSFEPISGLETLAGDDRHQALYIPDENERTGVYAYEPDGQPLSGDDTNRFGHGLFDSDAEGIVVYTCPPAGQSDDGRGFIVVADQRADETDFEVFDRVNWTHLGTVRLTGVANTDGIASTQLPLADYPLGLFAAVNDDSTTVAVGWDVIVAATGLSCE